MQLNIKKLQNIMRDDVVNGDAQRLEQIVWILFLKLYDLYEKEWKQEATISFESYKSIIEEKFQWDSWAKHKDNKDKKIKTLTGEELISFVNNELFPALQKIADLGDTIPFNQKIVGDAFLDAHNYMKNGYLLRELINEIDNIAFESDDGKIKYRKYLSHTYENLLKQLQNQKNSGEFYTPRAITDFIISELKPTLEDKIADLACGTGGFLISAYHYLEEEAKNSGKSLESLKSGKNFYGVELKQLPYILCATNFLINGVENPHLDHENAFLQFANKADLAKLPKFDIIVMNPPYGGSKGGNDLNAFDKDYRSNETADLFMYIILNRLKPGGKAAIVLPDGFLFGNDTAKINLKKDLLNKFNLHTILRLPKSVFAPYTSITTNILFFENNQSGTRETSFYRLDMPDGIKSYGKTKSIELSHLDPFIEWKNSGKKDIEINGAFKAKTYKKEELESRGYNFDLCGFVSEEEEILPPQELIKQVKQERERLNKTLNSIMDKIGQIIKDNQ